jgi:hypothetical protein
MPTKIIFITVKNNRQRIPPYSMIGDVFTSLGKQVHQIELVYIITYKVYNVHLISFMFLLTVEIVELSLRF